MPPSTADAAAHPSDGAFLVRRAARAGVGLLLGIVAVAMASAFTARGWADEARSTAAGTFVVVRVSDPAVFVPLRLRRLATVDYEVAGEVLTATIALESGVTVERGQLVSGLYEPAHPDRLTLFIEGASLSPWQRPVFEVQPLLPVLVLRPVCTLVRLAVILGTVRKGSWRGEHVLLSTPSGVFTRHILRCDDTGPFSRVTSPWTAARLGRTWDAATEVCVGEGAAVARTGDGRLYLLLRARMPSAVRDWNAQLDSASEAFQPSEA